MIKAIFYLTVITSTAVFAGTLDRTAAVDPLLPRQEDQTSYWIDAAKQFVHHQSQTKQNKNIAKNVIIFMGDGMSMSTLASTRPYIGGEEMSLSFEEFPTVGMAKTYCVDSQTADSSCAAAALLSGAKANYGTVGVTAAIDTFDCLAGIKVDTHTTSIAQWAIDAGKVAGFVATSQVTDSAPIGLYAHSGYRYWENDAEVRKHNCDPDVTVDMARQMVENELSRNFRVILGGGRGQFRNATIHDEEGQPGKRSDGRNLVNEWMSGKQNERAHYVWNAAELESVDAAHTDFLLGLFEGEEMNYNLDNVAAGSPEPTLTQMVEKAIEILSKNENGFFLFVESGRIDDAHHLNHARYALDETAELSKAVAMARAKLSVNDTLMLVTADHSHTMTYNGYPIRKNDIFGLADGDKWSLDGKPYMTLSYANGPGFKNHIAANGTRIDPRYIDTSGLSFEFPAVSPKSSESHGGDDVVVYASGPWSHLFGGSYEQSTIPYMAAYASCIGDSNISKACD